MRFGKYGIKSRQLYSLISRCIGLVLNRDPCLFQRNYSEMMRLLGIIRCFLVVRCILDPVLSFITDFQVSIDITDSIHNLQLSVATWSSGVIRSRKESRRPAEHIQAELQLEQCRSELDHRPDEEPNSHHNRQLQPFDEGETEEIGEFRRSRSQSESRQILMEHRTVLIISHSFHIVLSSLISLRTLIENK